MPLQDILSGYSKALYSTWIFYRPDRLLVDCGEGAATALGNGCFAIERVLLTHGHIDHVAGLMPLLWARAGGMGDNEKPLEIYFPAGDGYVEDLSDYVEKTRSRLPFALEWKPLQVGEEIELRAGRKVRTFATRHLKNGQSLGYKVVESRRRLQSEWAHLSETDLREKAKKGPDAIDEVMEFFEATRIAFGGDGLALRPEDVKNAEILLHEATILDAADRKHQLHSTLDEAMESAVAAGVKNLVLIHVSGRYRWDEVLSVARESAQRRGAEFSLYCLWRDKLREIRLEKDLL